MPCCDDWINPRELNITLRLGETKNFTLNRYVWWAYILAFIFIFFVMMFLLSLTIRCCCQAVFFHSKSSKKQEFDEPTEVVVLSKPPEKSKKPKPRSTSSPKTTLTTPRIVSKSTQTEPESKAATVSSQALNNPLWINRSPTPEMKSTLRNTSLPKKRSKSFGTSNDLLARSMSTSEKVRSRSSTSSSSSSSDSDHERHPRAFTPLEKLPKPKTLGRRSTATSTSDLERAPAAGKRPSDPLYKKQEMDEVYPRPHRPSRFGDLRFEDLGPEEQKQFIDNVRGNETMPGRNRTGVRKEYQI